MDIKIYGSQIELQPEHAEMLCLENPVEMDAVDIMALHDAVAARLAAIRAKVPPQPTTARERLAWHKETEQYRAEHLHALQAERIATQVIAATAIYRAQSS